MKHKKIQDFEKLAVRCLCIGINCLNYLAMLLFFKQ